MSALAHDQQGFAFCSYFGTGRPAPYHLSHHPQCQDVPGPAAHAQCLFMSFLKPGCCWNTMPAHEDSHPLSGKQNNAPRHLERSYLQRSDSICTYDITLPFESSWFDTAFLFCGAKVHDAQSRGAALLFCQRNSISQHGAVKW